MSQIAAPFRETFFPSAEMKVERRSDGSILVTPLVELEPFDPSIPGELLAWASRSPERTYLAQRPADGGPGSNTLTRR